MPRKVLFARARPSWTAASKLVGEAAVIFDTLATAIASSLNSGSKKAAAGPYGTSSHGLPLRRPLQPVEVFSKARAVPAEPQTERTILRHLALSQSVNNNRPSDRRGRSG